MTDPDSAARDAVDLGPLLYEERRHLAPAITYTGLGFAFLVTGLLCAAIPSHPPTPPHAYMITGGAIAAGGLLCLVVGLVRWIPNIGASWHLHEDGVRVRQRSGEHLLRYDQVDELTHKVVRVFFHGVCTGEVHDVAFKASASGEQAVRIKQVRRPSTASGSDLDHQGELAGACEKVAGLIAARMEAVLARGEAVPWVRDLRFHPDGLEVGSWGGNRIAWDQLEVGPLKDGKLRLAERGKEAAALMLPTELTNFHPGIRVLLARLDSAL